MSQVLAWCVVFFTMCGILQQLTLILTPHVQQVNKNIKNSFRT